LLARPLGPGLSPMCRSPNLCAEMPDQVAAAASQGGKANEKPGVDERSA